MKIDEIIEKKRLSPGDKDVLNQFIVENALRIVEDEGEFVKIKNLEGKPKEAKQGPLTILLSTPFTKLPDHTGYLLVMEQP